MPIDIPDLMQPIGNRYPIIEDTSILGGFRSVLNTTARDAIPANSRKAGMLVFCRTEVKLWQLDAGLTTWTEFSTGGGGFTPGGDLAGDDVAQIVTGVQARPITNDPSFNRSLTVSRTAATPFVNPYACTSDGTHIWVADLATTQVYKVNPADWSTWVSRVTLPADSSVRSLFCTTDYIICCCNNSTVCLISRATDTLVGYITLNSAYTEYACIDTSGQIWVPEGTSGDLVCYQVTDVLSAFPASPATGVIVVLGRGAAPTCLTFHAGYIWAGVESYLCRVDPATKDVTTQEGSTIHMRILGVGTKIWITPADTTGTAINVYETTTFPSAPTHLSDAGQFEGDVNWYDPDWMVSDGVTLWAADRYLGILYTFNAVTPAFTGEINLDPSAHYYTQMAFLGPYIWLGTRGPVDIGYSQLDPNEIIFSEVYTGFTGVLQLGWSYPTSSYLQPLSNILFIDGGTTLTEERDGSIARPFNSYAESISRAVSISYPGPTLLVTPGDYTAESPINWISPGNPPVSLNVKGLGVRDNQPTLPSSVRILSGWLNLDSVNTGSALRCTSATFDKVTSYGVVWCNYLVANDCKLGISTLAKNSLTFRNCTFDVDSRILCPGYTGVVEGAYVDTTGRNVLRIKFQGADPFLVVTVSEGSYHISVIRNEIAEAIATAYPTLVFNVEVDDGNNNDLSIYSGTGYLEFDSEANGSTLNPVIGFYQMDLIGVVSMDPMSLRSFRDMGVNYQGRINLIDAPPGPTTTYLPLVSGIQTAGTTYTLLGVLPAFDYSILGNGLVSFTLKTALIIPAGSTAQVRLYDVTNNTTVYESVVIAGPQTEYDVGSLLSELPSWPSMLELWLATPTNSGGNATCLAAGIVATFS